MAKNDKGKKKLNKNDKEWRTVAENMGMSAEAIKAVQNVLDEQRRERHEHYDEAFAKFRAKLERFDEIVKELDQASQDANDALTDLSNKVSSEDPKTDTGRP